MPNTYTQIHMHVVFATKYRRAHLAKEWRQDLFGYMSGIIENYDHKVLQINGIEDHVHLFFGMRPTQALSDLIKQVKQSSSKWINENNLVDVKFRWQGGFGAFSHSKSQVPKIIRYVQNQEEHHARKKFLQEYMEMLERFQVDYDPRYIFKPPE